MKLGILFSGGKDSTYAAWLAKKEGYILTCLITLNSENKESYMFHTPSITKTTIQAKAMQLPLIVQPTTGNKEEELKDLKEALQKAKDAHNIEGIVTGAVESVYQASRIQQLCNELGLICFNPLWQKNQTELLNDLLREGFHVTITGVFAYPFDQTWLGKQINHDTIKELSNLENQYAINVAGEGGEYETYVTNCPLFTKEIIITGYEDTGKEHSWRRELEAEL